ncbi:MAG: secretin N-terminal domain-containing protein [Betaproteobacteria bacterium]
MKELLLALARDTKRNIDIHPGISGLVSLNAINETLDAILERISKQVNLRYRTEGNTIIVSRDTPYVKTYRVNYVNTARTITSTINVTGEISSGGSQGGGSSGSAGSTSTGGSKTEVSSKTSNDFWEQLKDNIHSILISTRRITATDDEKAERAQEERSNREADLKRIEAASRAGAGASALIQSAAPAAQRPTTLQQTDVGKDVIVNPMSGTITVLATDKQHELIQRHMDSVINAMQRQVLIEATIVEVRLSNSYQGGIDWGRISGSGGFSFAQNLLGSTLQGTLATPPGVFGATATPFTQLAFNQNNTRPGDIQLAINLLQQFGNTRVLSSPKLMALNNQTALLKAVENRVYFEVQSTPAIVGTGGAITPGTTNTTAKTVSIGVVMGVTPQVNEDGRVTLIVRPTVSRLIGTGKQDPNPNLVIPNFVPEIQVQEMESVLQIGSGQTIILGGLMQDNVRYDRSQLPGADSLSGGAGVGGLGDLFRNRDESATKTELVIFLKPTVVTNPSLESDELKFFQRFLPQAESRPAPPTPAR